MDKKLESELIGNPLHWRLALGISSTELEIVAHSPSEDNSLIHRHIDLDSTAPTPLQALEKAVYDTPLLLLDFGRISCVIDTPQTIVAPPEVADDAEAALELMEMSFPGYVSETAVSPLGASNAVLVSGYDIETASFLRRTFFNTTLAPRLEPLCRYFLGVSRRVNTPRMFVNAGPRAIDIVAVDRGRLLVANTFRYDTPDDAAYYVMAIRRDAPLSDCELLVSGQPAARDTLMGLLRRFVPGVMPVIFPSEMFRAGREAMNCPFELIVQPLCE